MNGNHHISEEKLIDYVIGHVSDSEAAQIILHTNLCDQCQNKLLNWQNTLSDHRDAEAQAYRKEEVWEKLEGKRTSRKMTWSPKWIYSISASAIVAIFIISLALLNNIDRDPVEMAHYEKEQTEIFLNKPDTRRINIVPVTHDNLLDGNIWVNDITNEMLVELEGLIDLSNRDYQLWIIYTDDDMQGVIIPTQNGAARMFLEDLDVPNFKLIKASVEPKGGSSIPTGPETFIVEVRK